MDNDTKYTIKIITLWGAVPLFLLFGLVFYLSYLSCMSQTKNIGFPSRYEMMSGCMIEPQEGQWIPLNNWRMFGD